jgi:hypothetical protein
MEYVISYASVLLPQCSCQLQWHSKIFETFQYDFLQIEEYFIYPRLIHVNRTCLIKAV